MYKKEQKLDKSYNLNDGFYKSCVQSGDTYSYLIDSRLNVLIFFILITISIACNDTLEQSQKTSVQSLRSNNIVLIFEKPPLNWRYDMIGGGWTHNKGKYQLRYIDDHGIVRLLDTKIDPESDTIIIETNRDILEVQHAYKGLDNLSFLFQNGDSVLFTYKGLKPIAHILNREADSLEINYELFKREKIVKNEFPGLVQQQVPDSSSIHVDILKRLPLDEKRGREYLLLEYFEEQKLLDSLKGAKILTTEVYDFYKHKSRYDVHTLFFPIPWSKTNTIAVGNKITISSLVHDEGSDLSNSFISKTTIKELLSTKNDHLLKYSYYQHFIDIILRRYFAPKARVVQAYQGSHRDFRQVYDSIKETTWLSPKAKEIMLLKTYEEIINTAAVEDIQKFRERIYKDVSDTIYISHLDQKFNIGNRIHDEMYLKDLKGDIISFEEMVERYNGKIIYIDFWASWCTPCIKAMPASIDLKKQYHDSEIVFVHISLDEEKRKWENVALKNNLIKNSFLISNKFTTKKIRALRLESIPRYMLYNKDGKLLDDIAPSPESNEIRDLIDQYL